MLNRRRSYSHTFICIAATLLLILGYSNYAFAEGKADGHNDPPVSTETHPAQNSTDEKQVEMNTTKTGQNESKTAAVATGSNETHTVTNVTTGSNETHAVTNVTTGSNETHAVTNVTTGSNETHAVTNVTTGSNETHPVTNVTTGSNETHPQTNVTTGINETHTETGSSETPMHADEPKTGKNETVTVSNSTQSSNPNQTAGAAPTVLSIFLVNDLQYDIFPVHRENGSMCLTHPEAEECVGGLPSLKTLMDDQANLTDGIWLNAGNTLGGDLFRTLKFGTAVRAMNLLNFNATAVGPSVFKYGGDAGRTYMDGLKKSIVVSNIVPAPPQKSLMFTVGNCNVSVIGYLQTTEQDQNVWGVNITNYTQSVLKEVTRIRQEQKNVSNLITVVIGSSSVNESKILASNETIDFVFFSGANWSAEAEKNKTQNASQFFWEPVIQKSNKTAYVGSLRVNHSDMTSRFIVGLIELPIADSCSVANANFTVLNYTTKTTTSNTTALDLIKSELYVLQSQDKSLTVNNKNLTAERDMCCHSECSLGDLITDAMVAAVNGDSTWSDNATRIGIFPAVHLQPNATIPKGSLTVTNLSGLIDEDEYIYTVLLTGRQLKDILEVSINSSSNSNSTDFLHVSRLLQIQYKQDHDNKSQIVSVKTVSAGLSSMQLSEIDVIGNATVYNVSLPLMLLKMDSYKKMPNAVNATFHPVTIVEAVTKHINNTGALSLPVLGSRFILLEPKPAPPPPIQCVDHTGTTVAVTLVVAALIVGLILGVWRYVFGRYRPRSDSTLRMIDLDD